ncbi:MAG: pantoate--beta-alanine ligase [Planctomycetota bacterium]
MQVAEKIAEFRRLRAECGNVAFVPTMGALHEGHLALIRAAKTHAATVAVSIFVNPTQFGANEDLSQYPRPIKADLAKCDAEGVDLVLNPSPQEIYPTGTLDTIVDLPELTGKLEGRHRPGHFRGVCQVVLKLFNIVRPTVAVFGRKDFQQLRVIEAMVEALDVPVQIVGEPTVRESDGLALSSRNVYLAPDERRRALSIIGGLRTAKAEYESGIEQTNRLESTVRNAIMARGSVEQGDNLGHIPVSIDYVQAVDPRTLEPRLAVDGPTIMVVAARIGKTRLIDNLVIRD